MTFCVMEWVEGSGWLLCAAGQAFPDVLRIVRECPTLRRWDVE